MSVVVVVAVARTRMYKAVSSTLRSFHQLDLTISSMSKNVSPEIDNNNNNAKLAYTTSVTSPFVLHQLARAKRILIGYLGEQNYCCLLELTIAKSLSVCVRDAQLFQSSL